MLTDTMRRTFREQGYVVVPGVLTDAQLGRGLALVEELLAADPPPPGHVGQLARWPRFTATGDNPLLDFYREVGVAELAAQLVREDLPLQDPDFAQLAVTVPPWPHRPGGPHVDGITPTLPDGTPGTFTLLAGVWLSDQTAPYTGNLWVWPGTHLRAGAYFAEHGADALARADELRPGPFPDVEWGEPVQAACPTGSVLFAHYLLGHNFGGHDGPADAAWRRTLYYRVRTVGHRQRWRTVVTEPLHEFQ